MFWTAARCSETYALTLWKKKSSVMNLSFHLPIRPSSTVIHLASLEVIWLLYASANLDSLLFKNNTEHLIAIKRISDPAWTKAKLPLGVYFKFCQSKGCRNEVLKQETGHFFNMCISRTFTALITFLQLLGHWNNFFVFLVVYNIS